MTFNFSQAFEIGGWFGLITLVYVFLFIWLYDGWGGRMFELFTIKEKIIFLIVITLVMFIFLFVIGGLTKQA